MNNKQPVAVPDYDGSVWVEGFGEPFRANIGLSDELRCAESYPVEFFNDKWVIRFPFGVLDLADDRDKIVTSIMHYGYEHDPMDALMNKCNRLESVLIAVLTSMDVPQMRRTLEALGHQIVEDEEMIHKK